jgi:hypothetical protein
MLDRDIRTLLHKVYLTQYRDGESCIVEEMGLSAHTVRIDIGVINGSLVGYEIKSEHDNLNRLPKQIEIYDQIFDRLTLISGQKHLAKLLAMLPPHWGILVPGEQDGEPCFHTERPATPNPNRNAYMIASLLWHEEAKDLLEQHGISKLARLRRWELWEKVAEYFSLEDVSSHVRRILKQRKGWPRPLPEALVG